MKDAVCFFISLHVMVLIIRPDAIAVQLALLGIDSFLIPFLLNVYEVIIDKTQRIVKKNTRWGIIGKRKEEIARFDEILSIDYTAASNSARLIHLVLKTDHRIELWNSSSYEKIQNLKGLIQEYIS